MAGQRPALRSLFFIGGNPFPDEPLYYFPEGDAWKGAGWIFRVRSEALCLHISGRLCREEEHPEFPNLSLALLLGENPDRGMRPLLRDRARVRFWTIPAVPDLDRIAKLRRTWVETEVTRNIRAKYPDHEPSFEPVYDDAELTAFLGDTIIASVARHNDRLKLDLDAMRKIIADFGACGYATSWMQVSRRVPGTKVTARVMRRFTANDATHTLEFVRDGEIPASSLLLRESPGTTEVPIFRTITFDGETVRVGSRTYALPEAIRAERRTCGG